MEDDKRVLVLIIMRARDYLLVGVIDANGITLCFAIYHHDIIARGGKGERDSHSKNKKKKVI